MYLTDREKRTIATPNSMSGQQLWNAKFHARSKILQILQDMQFITEHKDMILQEFGIDVYEMLGLDKKQDTVTNTTDDSDLL